MLNRETDVQSEIEERPGRNALRITAFGYGQDQRFQFVRAALSRFIAGITATTGNPEVLKRPSMDDHTRVRRIDEGDRCAIDINRGDSHRSNGVVGWAHHVLYDFRVFLERDLIVRPQVVHQRVRHGVDGRKTLDVRDCAVAVFGRRSVTPPVPVVDHGARGIVKHLPCQWWPNVLCHASILGRPSYHRLPNLRPAPRIGARRAHSSPLRVDGEGLGVRFLPASARIWARTTGYGGAHG